MQSSNMIFSVGVVYSGEYDVCDLTLSVYPHRARLKNMPGHGGNRSYNIWNTSPMLCQLSYTVVGSIPTVARRVFRKRRPTKTKTEDLRWVFVITKTKTHYENEDPSLFSYYENEDHKIFIYTLFS